MKKYYNRRISDLFIYLLVVSVFLSCSQNFDDIINTNKPNTNKSVSHLKLRFVSDVSTRGTMLKSISTMSDNDVIGVYGYACKKDATLGLIPNLIDNGACNKNGNISIDSLKAKDMEHVQLVAVYPRPKNSDINIKKIGASKYTLDYSIDTAEVNQKDLMIGQTEMFTMPSAANQDVPKKLLLHHALTSVNFALGPGVPTGYCICGIEIVGVKVKGKCEVDLSNSVQADNRFSWTPEGKNIKKCQIRCPNIKTTQDVGTQVTGVSESKTNKQDNLTMFMIPQPLTEDAKAIIYLAKDKSFSVSADTTKSEDTDYRPFKKLRLTINLMTKDKNKWNAGANVLYTINPAPYKGKTENYFLGGDKTSLYLRNKTSGSISIKSFKYAIVRKVKRQEKIHPILYSATIYLPLKLTNVKYKLKRKGEEVTDINYSKWLKVEYGKVKRDPVDSIISVDVKISLDISSPDYPNFDKSSEIFLTFEQKGINVNNKKQLTLRVARMPKKK